MPPRDIGKDVGDDESPSDILLRRMLEDYRSQDGVCSITGSVYCTAWVSMVAKPVEGKLVWLFPASFQYICDHQDERGAWQGGALIDEILTTLACLLSLKKHEADEVEHPQLSDRIARAVAFLRQAFIEWDVTDTDRVAFEILIPTMLELLEQEGVQFSFPNYETLLQLREAKLSKFRLDQLYNYPTPLLFSLEAFIGKIDFDRVRHHLSEGGMMCSPSSTAAYLMNISGWDERAENYLRKAVNNGRRNGEGTVATIYPMAIFELTWVHTTQRVTNI